MLTFSLDIWPLHDEHQGAKASFWLVVFAANALKIEVNRYVFSMALWKNHSIGISLLLCPKSQPVLPKELLLAFFFLKTHLGQITKRQKNQKYMAMPARPRPPLMVVQPQLFLQLLIPMFNPEPFMEKSNNLNRWHRLRHITEKVTQFVLSLFFPASFDDQPYLFMPGALPITVRRPSPFPFFRLRHFKHGRLHEHLRSRIDSYHIALPTPLQSLTKLGDIPIPPVRNHRPMRNPLRTGKINLLKRYFPLLSIARRIGHMRLVAHHPTLRIIQIVPTLRNEQIHRIRPGGFLPHIGHTYSHLAIFNFPPCPTVLPSNTYATSPLFGETRIVYNKNPLGITRLRQHLLPIFSHDPCFIPDHIGQQTLHSSFRTMNPSRHRLDRFSFPIHHQPNNVTLSQIPSLRSAEITSIGNQIFSHILKVDLLFHEGIISNPLLKNIIFV